MLLKYFIFNALALILLTGCTEAKVEKVIIYGGKYTHTITNPKKLQIFGENISGFTKNIDDVLKIILTPSQIDKTINNEYGIEIQYSSKQRVYKTNNKYPISFSKIYIPLSGKYSKLGIVYFFGDEDGYGGLPPYVTNEGLRELKKLVQQIEK